MKFTWKRIFAFALTMILLLSLAACSGAPSMGVDRDEGHVGTQGSGQGSNQGNDVIQNPSIPSSGNPSSGNPSNGNSSGTMAPEMDDAEMVAPGDIWAEDDVLLPGESFDSAGSSVEKPQPPSVVENPFISTAEEAVSTFSADVDTASYTYFRKLVNAGYSLESLRYFASSFRTEEFLNYFKYEAAAPAGGELFGVSKSVTPCPWDPTSALLTMTLRATDAVPSAGNNLVFLIDVSGSMMSEDKLPLLKTSFRYLVGNLTANDTISIVTYSGKEEVVLEGCNGAMKELILTKIDSLVAGGSTNGEAGLRTAYEIAAEYRIEGGNNRIIMASDGDLNVGMSSVTELEAYVSEQRAGGIYLSVLGFGTGNYRDANMETLADNGNGVYYYIDGASEGERVFGTNLFGTLYTVAEDVKLQLTFNPDHVSSYRLIGYENRMLENDDFLDDTKDAGEVGSGHCVTVCYEIKLTETAKTDGTAWMGLAVNYKNPGETTSLPPRVYFIGYSNYSETMNEDERFRAAVIELCLVLHQSQYLPEGSEITLSTILDDLNNLDLSNHPDRAEFRTLVQKLVG